MKRVLLTGATGFIGRNILPQLRARYHVVAPSRAELDLLDASATKRFLSVERFDAVVNLAAPTGHNPLDKPGELFERSLRVFTSLAVCSGLYGKMIQIGSGAEYGKHRALTSVREEDFGDELPRDAYGLSRYLMSELAESYHNIVHLRLFGCYGPTDPPHKLVPSIIRCACEEDRIVLNQECWFDFLYVEDIADVLIHFIENGGAHRAYNLCSGSRVRISSIAEEVCKQMGVKKEIMFTKEGFNLEYTGSNERLRTEMNGWTPLSMPDSIHHILTKEDVL